MTNEVIEHRTDGSGGVARSTRVGERFARSLARKDASALKSMLHPEVDFMALTPGKFWEAHDTEVVVDDIILGTWFQPGRRITETISVDSDVIGGAEGAEEVERVGYRFRVARPDGEFILEQQAYFRVDGDQIAALRIMCTGFLPIET